MLEEASNLNLLFSLGTSVAETMGFMCVWFPQIRATTDDVFSALRRHSSTQHQKLSDNKPFTMRRSAHSNQNWKHSNDMDDGKVNFNGVPELWSKQHAVNSHPEQKVRERKECPFFS